MKHRHVVHQSVCCRIAQLFAIIVAMDTKLGRIYCTISECNLQLYFRLQLPQTFTDRNETYGILRANWGLQRFVSKF